MSANTSSISQSSVNTSPIITLYTSVFNSNIFQTSSVSSSVSSNSSITTSNNTFSGNNVFTGQLDINNLIENITSSTVSSNTLSISYTSNNGIIIISPSSASNISLTLTNIPTTYTNANINITFIINVGTYKQYINTININGTGYTMKAAGGLSNISIPSSSLIVIQNVNILFLSGSISQVLTSVNGWF